MVEVWEVLRLWRHFWILFGFVGPSGSMWSRISMWIHVVQEKGEGQFIIEDNFATGQFTSWFTTITVFEYQVWKSINFWNLFILYHFYVVLRGNLGVFVSWRFSCTCKQLLQGAVCAQNIMLFITHLLHQHHLHHHLHLHKQSHHNRHCRQSEDSILRAF